MKKIIFTLSMFFLGLQCDAMVMQGQSDIESIKQRNADLQRVSGYDDLDREVIALSTAESQQKFVSTIQEIVRKIDVLFAFIQRQTDRACYPMFGTLLGSVGSKLRYEQTKAGSQFDAYINAMPISTRDHAKQTLRDKLNITVP